MRADLHVALCEKHEELTPRTRMLRREPRSEADGQFLAETAGSPGRQTSAGHMKLAYVLMFVGMIPEFRFVAEIRS